MSDHSFDIVSDYNPQELANALDQARREMATRFDFKGSTAQIEQGKDELIVHAESDVRLKSVIEILQHKLVKRNLSIKVLDMSKPVEAAAGSSVRQHIQLRKGLSQEQAKQVTKAIRDSFPKVKASIQGDAIRVTHKDLDELQAVQAKLRATEFEVALQFQNYR